MFNILEYGSKDYLKFKTFTRDNFDTEAIGETS